MLMANLADVDHAEGRLLLGNRCYGKGGLAKHGTTHENVLTGAGVPYSINGVMYSKAATAELDLSALTMLAGTGLPLLAAPAQPAGTACVYLLLLDASGTVKVLPGLPAPASGPCPCPGLLPDHAPLGAIKVVNGTVNPFVIGTTALNTASLTVTYVDLASVPAVL